MISIPRAKASIPDELSVHTVAHMTLDEPRIASQGSVYVDPSNQSLYLERNYRFDPHMRGISTGRVAIMRCLGWDDEMGYVVDLRHVSTPEVLSTLPTGDAAIANHFAPVAAYAERGRIESDTQSVHLVGNGDFYAAAVYLTKLVDAQGPERSSSALQSLRVAYYAELAKRHERIANCATLLTGV